MSPRVVPPSPAVADARRVSAEGALNRVRRAIIEAEVDDAGSRALWSDCHRLRRDLRDGVDVFGDAVAVIEGAARRGLFPAAEVPVIAESWGVRRASR